MKVRPGSDFRPSRDGPWPAIETNGELAPAEREWLHTNGAGAYSMSTIALMHTRRHHGAFVAALPPPLGRHVIISHAETSITPELERRTFRLATHQFPSLAPTPGYRHLSSFAIDPIPRWVFRIGHHQLERTLCLARGKNVLVTGYTWKGRGSALLQVRPLMPLRPVDRLVSEHGGMMQVISMKPGAVEMKPVPSLPSVVFGHEGMFMGSPDWWRRFEYLADRSDGRAFQEDIWTPGVFQMQLEPGRTAYLVAAIGGLPSESPEQLIEEARAAISAEDPGEERPESVRALEPRDEPHLEADPRCVHPPADAAVVLVGQVVEHGEELVAPESNSAPDPDDGVGRHRGEEQRRIDADSEHAILDLREGLAGRRQEIVGGSHRSIGARRYPSARRA